MPRESEEAFWTSEYFVGLYWDLLPKKSTPVWDWFGKVEDQVPMFAHKASGGFPKLCQFFVTRMDLESQEVVHVGRLFCWDLFRWPSLRALNGFVILTTTPQGALLGVPCRLENSHIDSLTAHIWVWLKIKQQGQTAGFGPCSHLPGQAILVLVF